MAEDGLREVRRSVDRTIGIARVRAIGHAHSSTVAPSVTHVRRAGSGAARAGVAARVDSLRPPGYGVLLMVKVLVPTLRP